LEEQYKLPVEQPNNEEESSTESVDGEYDVVPGVPVVRTNTPRPLPFGLTATKTELPLAPSGGQSDFPAEAPESPPLPEDPTDTREPLSDAQKPQHTPGAVETTLKPLPGEFIWLFEYALDMDPLYLNRPERLNGSAFAYGPAVLKGYRLIFEGLDTRTGHVIASLVAVPAQPEAEVWGMLYRVPRRFTQGSQGESPLLDRVHFPDAFVPVELTVRETYRQRQVSCVAYIASEATQQQVYRLPLENRIPEPVYLKRLLQVARRQKLPAEYIHILEELVPSVIPAARPLPTTPPEQITEPLPALLPRSALHSRVVEPMEAEEMALADQVYPPETWEEPSVYHLHHWLMAFALYICLLLLGTLTLAVIEGAGLVSEMFTATFAPLGIPWYVLLYGLLGGCVSCVVSLARPPQVYPPNYVVLTWFIRPFLGALLAALACLVLNSGLFQVAAQPTQHFALYSLGGALAGFCEGKIVLRKG
jgi:hypothetical protein